MSNTPTPYLAAISLGSNIHPVENLKAAVRELAGFGRIVRVSSVWESPAVGFADQPNFLNAAVLLETYLTATELKQTVLGPLEDNLHRVRDPNNVNAPRTIDLDLSIFLTPSRTSVLDEDILTRNFVAVPLAEILPDYQHPDTGQTLAEIAKGFESSSPSLKPRPDCNLALELSTNDHSEEGHHESL